jgi:hypothetical protein
MTILPMPMPMPVDTSVLGHFGDEVALGPVCVALGHVCVALGSCVPRNIILAAPTEKVALLEQQLSIELEVQQYVPPGHESKRWSGLPNMTLH